MQSLLGNCSIAVLVLIIITAARIPADVVGRAGREARRPVTALNIQARSDPSDDLFEARSVRYIRRSGRIQFCDGTQPGNVALRDQPRVTALISSCGTKSVNSCRIKRQMFDFVDEL